LDFEKHHDDSINGSVSVKESVGLNCPQNLSTFDGKRKLFPALG